MQGTKKLLFNLIFVGEDFIFFLILFLVNENQSDITVGGNMFLTLALMFKIFEKTVK